MSMSLREQAGLPPYRELNWITLEAIRRLPMPATNDEIDEAVATTLNLTPTQRAVLATNGRQTAVAYLVAWCRTTLRNVGALERAGRGLWRLTPEGADMSEETVTRRRADYRRSSRVRWAEKRRSQAETAEAAGHHSEAEEFEELGWNDELLARLQAMSASGFERLAERLLRASEFEDVNVTGRAGDGGIDGTALYRLSLISFPVYFQCKRYKGSVGPAVVRDFRGAMAGRSDRGLIITTGSFSREAKLEATRDGATPLDLIDGESLCELLKERGLGVEVRERTVEDVTIDDEYFDRFETAPDR